MSSTDPPSTSADAWVDPPDDDPSGQIGVVSHRIDAVSATLAAVVNLSRRSDYDALARQQFGALVKDMESYLRYLQGLRRRIAADEPPRAEPPNLHLFRGLKSVVSRPEATGQIGDAPDAATSGALPEMSNLSAR